MKMLTLIINSLFVLLLLCVAALFTLPLLPIERNIDLRIVQSGSMEPAIKTGSVVVLFSGSHYEAGDVIAFTSSSSRIPTTHRIVGVEEKNGERLFTTKGDANEEADNQLVAQGDVLGKVLFSVPYAGFILDFARQPLGFALLIILPALLIIFGELEKIWHEVKKKKVAKKKEEVLKESVSPDMTTDAFEVKEVVRMIEINRPIVQHEKVLRLRRLSVRSVRDHGANRLSFKGAVASVLAVVVGAGVYGLGFVGSTVSYFNDSEASAGNMLSALTLDFTTAQDGTLYTFVDEELPQNPIVVAPPIPVAESAAVLYEMHVEVTTPESVSFCEAILADAGAPLSLSDVPLVDLSATGVLFTDPWDLVLSLSSPFTNGETCGVDIVYTAWHAEGTFGEGYHDEERMSLTFQAPVVVAPLHVQSFELLISTPEEDQNMPDVQTVLIEEEAVEPALPEPALVRDEETPEIEETEVTITKEEEVVDIVEEPEEIQSETVVEI